jgi:hypothetical protein
MGLFVFILSTKADTQSISQTFTTSGTFTVPAGVTSIIVECWGGGGAGGGNADNSLDPAGAGGGAGGAYARKTLIVTPGTDFTVTVGATVTGDFDGGANGNPSWFGTAATVYAQGGAGGGAATNAQGAAGLGSSSASIGDFVAAGGNGANGTDATGGGGGGGGAGSGGNGGNASGITAGTGTATGGGNGGNGGPTSEGNGANGSTFGGGGGGAFCDDNSDHSGGDGAAGRVIVTYVPAYRASFTAMDFGSNLWFAGETRTVSVTVTNTGQATWTDATPDINIGVKWNADPDYLVRVNAGNLASGATQTYSLTITAPSTAGSENLTFDVVNEGSCWFADNSGSCGPGNTVYTSSAITILPGSPGYHYTSTGSFTVLPGVTSVKVECWGGGGGGSTITSNGARGGGGGGGAYASSIVTVIPGNTYNVVVGAAGGASTAGGASSFGTGLVVAAGGTGGTNNSATAGAGGTTAASTGTTKYAGGAGANGGAVNSGGGGGGAGSTGAGGPASGATAGTGTSLYGGTGGTGQSGSQDGQPGSYFGGGGSGAVTNSNTDRTGGSGYGGLVVITLPSSITLSSPSQIPADSIFQGITKQPVFSFATAASTSNALLQSVSFTTAGSYTASDIVRFQLWYSTTNDIATASQIGSNITTSLGTGLHSFTGLNTTTSSGTTGYFWITADVANTATHDATLSVNSISSSDLTYEIAVVTGTSTAGGVQTIQLTPNVVLSSNNPAVAAASVAQGTIDQPVYAFRTAITNTKAVLTAVSFTTTGTCTGNELVRFKLWYNSSNSFATALNIGSGIISALGAGTHTFSGFSQSISSGETGYFWITADITSFPTNGRTLTVSALTTADLTFVRAIQSGSASAGGTMTISTSTGILLGSTRPAVSANSIVQGSLKQPVYKFTTIITGSNATLTGVTFTTTGSYVASDVVNFKLWYSTLNSLVGATQIGSVTTSLGTGSHTFGSFTSTTTNAGSIGYFWITVDLNSSAVSPHTLSVNAITTANLTYTAGTKSGTAYDGGIQTIANMTDIDGDGVADIYDLDDDNDGIPDIVENAPCNVSAIELFPNTDFSAGNTGFSSAYTYAAPAGDHTLWPEGLYTIVTNPQSIHASFAACGDHTTGTGNMLVVNADPVAGKIVWSSGNVPVTVNTDYTLSFFMSSVTPTNPAQLIWNVNGENIGSQFNATTTNCQWINAVAIWNSGNNTTATFDIINLNTVASGNDFALDDISCKYRENCKSDADLVQDRLDLDSDNDGIYDVVEAGGTDANNDGLIDGYTTDADNDGLADIVDNQDAGNGASEVKNGTPLPNPDTDLDGLPNTIDIESDADGCYDVKEAGYSDANNDGILGTAPVSYDGQGKVTGSYGGYVTPVDANSDGTRDYVQRIPVITTQPDNSNICAPSTGTSFSVIATNPGGTYQWQVKVNSSASWTDVSNAGVYSGAQTSTLTISSAVTLAYDGYMYRVLLSNNGYKCSPLISDEVTLRVFTGSPATPGTISGDATVCPSISSSYSISPVAQALTYNWTVPAGWSITSGDGTTGITATTAASGSGNITVTATNTCGTSAATTLAVSIASPAPTFTVTPSNPSCQGSNLTYATQSGKSNYTWSFTGLEFVNYTIISGGTPADDSVTLRWLNTGSQTVSINYTSGGCQAASPVSYAITVNANAIINSHPANPAAVCANAGTATMSVTASGTISGYQWQYLNGAVWTNLANNGTYSGVTTSTLTITNPAAGLNGTQYHCLVTGSCGDVTSNSATLTVNAIPSVPGIITGTSTQCPSQTGQTYSIAAVTGATSYTWTVPTGWSVTAGAGSTGITVTTGAAGQNGDITVTATNSCGTSSASTLPVTVDPGTPAVPGAITGTSPQCPALTGQTYSISAVSGASTYTWTVPVGWTITGGSGTTAITVTTGTAGQDGNITVTAGNSCGTSAARSLSVTVNQKPSIADKTTTVYSGVAFSVTPVNGTDVVPAGTTYSWPLPSVTGAMTGGATGSGEANISGTLNNPTSSAQTGTYTVTPTASSCPGSDFTVTVTVNAIPVITDMTSTVCSGNGFTATPADGTNGIVPAGTTYSWNAPTVTGGLTGGASGSGAANVTGTLSNPTNNVQTATYTVTPLTGTYTGNTFTVTVTVNPVPSFSISSETTVCEETTITLEAGAGFAAYEWRSGVTVLGTSHDLTITTGTVDTDTPVVESYSVKVTNTYGCESSDTQDISVYHKPETGPDYYIPNTIHN